MIRPKLNECNGGFPMSQESNPSTGLSRIALGVSLAAALVAASCNEHRTGMDSNSGATSDASVTDTMVFDSSDAGINFDAGDAGSDVETDVDSSADASTDTAYSDASDAGRDTIEDARSDAGSDVNGEVDSSADASADATYSDASDAGRDATFDSGGGLDGSLDAGADIDTDTTVTEVVYECEDTTVALSEGLQVDRFDPALFGVTIGDINSPVDQMISFQGHFERDRDLDYVYPINTADLARLANLVIVNTMPDGTLRHLYCDSFAEPAVLLTDTIEHDITSFETNCVVPSGDSELRLLTVEGHGLALNDMVISNIDYGEACNIELDQTVAKIGGGSIIYSELVALGDEVTADTGTFQNFARISFDVDDLTILTELCGYAAVSSGDDWRTFGGTISSPHWGVIDLDDFGQFCLPTEVYLIPGESNGLSIQVNFRSGVEGGDIVKLAPESRETLGQVSPFPGSPVLPRQLGEASEISGGSGGGFGFGG